MAKRRLPIASPRELRPLRRTPRSIISRSSAKADSDAHARGRSAPRDAQRRLDRDGQCAQSSRAICGAGLLALVVAAARVSARVAGRVRRRGGGRRRLRARDGAAARGAGRFRRHRKKRERRSVRTVRRARLARAPTASSYATKRRRERCARRVSRRAPAQRHRRSLRVRRRLRGRGTPLDGFVPALALFPGSRESAYDDARFLLEVVRVLAAIAAAVGRGALDRARPRPGQVCGRLRRDAGWDVARESHERSAVRVEAATGATIVRAWRGAIGPLLARATLVLGQAGTANEAAAAAGVPVVAFERERDRKTQWYRKRQQGLLGEALAVLPAELPALPPA